MGGRHGGRTKALQKVPGVSRSGGTAFSKLPS